jgi:hypothetical protein
VAEIQGGEIIDDLPHIESNLDKIFKVKSYDPSSTRAHLGLNFKNIWQE